MSFIPRTFEMITTELVAWLMSSPEAGAAAPDMDLTPGSIERSHLEAVAVQVEELEVRTAQSVAESIQESCFRAFGFSRLAARIAYGSVVFTALKAPLAPIPIPAGTRVMGPSGQVFVTAANAQLDAGATTTGLVTVSAMVAGPGGNVPARSITRMVGSIQGLDLVTNPSPTIGGTEMESDEGRVERFSAYIRTLQRGTREALEFAALSVSGIVDARTVEPYLIDPRPAGVPYAGLVWVFCDDGAGLTPESKTQVERVINGYTDGTGAQVPGWKAAGVRVEVIAAPIAPVCLRGTVKLFPGGAARWDAIKATLSDALNTFFSGVRIGDVVSYQALSALLNTSDPDVVEVNLFMWAEGGITPGYADTPMAADFDPVAPDVPLSLGSRCVLSSSVPPEWVIA